jgi:hypothetical protein
VKYIEIKVKNQKYLDFVTSLPVFLMGFTSNSGTVFTYLVIKFFVRAGALT